jgi:enoyl-[acyl-carrier-protein] reductase (NADH)
MMEAYVAWQSKSRGVPGEQVRAELDAKFPLGYIPEDADVAELATFLVSDRGRAITGQSLLVNAGEFMR